MMRLLALCVTLTLAGCVDEVDEQHARRGGPLLPVQVPLQLLVRIEAFPGLTLIDR